jgi:hypothetical protein
MISCQCEEPVGSSTLPTVPPGQLAIASTSPPLASPTNVATVDPKQNVEYLEQILLKVKEPVHSSTLSGVGTAGIIMGAVSSDHFGAVMGILERLVQIGDAISEVRFCIPSNSYFFIEMLPGAPIRKACVDRVDRCAKGSYHLPTQR